MTLDKLMDLIQENKLNVNMKDFKIEYYKLMQTRINKMNYNKDEYSAKHEVKELIADNYATKMLMEKYKLGEWK